jgi:predicted metal-dependent peptidase
MPDGTTRVVVMLDAEGRATDDPRRTVRGEIQETKPDGSTEVTLFEVDPSAAVPAR